MKIGHRHGERHKKEGSVLFIPIKIIIIIIRRRRRR